MKLLFEQCLDCEYGKECYSKRFDRCRKIENAGHGLGIPVRQKDDSYINDIPFGVYIGLKHIVNRRL